MDKIKKKKWFLIQHSPKSLKNEIVSKKYAENATLDYLRVQQTVEKKNVEEPSN